MADDNTGYTANDSDDGPIQGNEIPISESDSSDVESLRTRVSELEQQAGQYKDQLLRKAADFDNYKRRIENELSTAIRYGTEDLLLKLLPIIDDFERSLKAASGDSSAEDAVRKGIELIYSKLKKVLEQQGVKEFESTGRPFDPAYHDALLQVPRADLPPHTIIEEVEKGYMLNDKVLRHARVIVSADDSSNNPASPKKPQL